MAQNRKPRKKTAPKKKKPAAKKAIAPRKRSARRAAAPAPLAPAENVEAKRLAHRIAHLVLGKKATDVTVLDVRGLTSYADYFVVASGESERQVSAMAEHVQITLKEEGEKVVGAEGVERGSWVLLDYGEVVAHLFFAQTRAFYDLEGLWADAPREKVV